MKLPEQVRHLGLVIGVLLVAVVALRFFVIPPGFFSRELHEAAAVKADRDRRAADRRRLDRRRMNLGNPTGVERRGGDRRTGDERRNRA